MALAPGTRLGAYEILTLIGRGGMGEVYRARDPRLARDVAIKILPADVGADPDRLARFEQEARATAALNHPNILAVHDIGSGTGVHFVVSELLDGETLRDGLAHGALPIRRAVDYAIQVAQGLAAAHDRGIVHRDLKPENIFVTRGGRVKILDFGLAKLTEARPAAATMVPTTPVATAAGLIVGTIGYMAPEQVRGLSVDHRADLFALGAILYELLTGKRAFAAATPADTMSAILKEDPPQLASAATTGTPGLQRIVQRCLAKTSEQRFQSASDLAFALESTAESPDRLTAAPLRRDESARRWLPWFVAAVTALGAFMFAVMQARARREEAPLVSFAVPPPKNSGIGFAALSPDGRRLVLRVIDAGGQRRLWIRSLDSLAMQPLPATEGGERPFWSPDGRFIGFFTGQLLKKLDLASGAVQVITNVGIGAANGAAWSPSGVVIFSGNLSGLYRVPAEGGTPQPLTTLDVARHETRHYFPAMLPDGDHFLYVVTSADATARGLWVASLSDPPTKHRLLGDLSQGAYSQGYLLFARNGALMAQPFDADRLTLRSDAKLIADNVNYNPVYGFSDFSVSDSGVLAYLPVAELWRLTWFDRTGRRLETVGAGGTYQSLSMSPDGTRVAADGVLRLESNYHLFVVDHARGTTTQITFGSASGNLPVWSPDGSMIAFGSNRAGHYDIYRKPAAASGSEEVLLSNERNKFVMDWSRDGKWLLYGEVDPKTTKEALSVLSMTGERRSVPYLPADADHREGRFSPDGRFIAFVSDESSMPQVYVETFPEGGGKWQVSANGGTRPRWRRDGNELYYLSATAELMAVPINHASQFTPGTPAKLFDTWARNSLAGFEVSPDGHRFLMLAPAEDFVPTPANVLLNWSALLRK